jgi:hypothetical protein
MQSLYYFMCIFNFPVIYSVILLIKYQTLADHNEQIRQSVITIHLLITLRSSGGPVVRDHHSLIDYVEQLR